MARHPTRRKQVNKHEHPYWQRRTTQCHHHRNRRSRLQCDWWWLAALLALATSSFSCSMVTGFQLLLPQKASTKRTASAWHGVGSGKQKTACVPCSAFSAFSASSLSIPESNTTDVLERDATSPSTDNDIGTYTSIYRSSLLESDDDWNAFWTSLQVEQGGQQQELSSTTVGMLTGGGGAGAGLGIGLPIDAFWEQIKHEAQTALRSEPQAGPLLYQGILSQPSLLAAICTIVSHEIETELIPATMLRNLFRELLTVDDEWAIRRDLQAVATRSPSVHQAMEAALFHNGFHSLVCYRVGHRLWQANRTGLAYFMQSTVSRIYSADIHPACVMGSGIYLRVGAGVVIGETAVVGNDVSILEGVTLGGTGKEAGNRHPKVADGVLIEDGGTVLGNIPVGEGSVVTAKSIVTKPVPPLAIVRGVPAKVERFRELMPAAFANDIERHLVDKYLEKWRALLPSDETSLKS